MSDTGPQSTGPMVLWCLKGGCFIIHMIISDESLFMDLQMQNIFPARFNLQGLNIKLRSLFTKPEDHWSYIAHLSAQAWKYMTICCISFHPCRSIRKQIWPCQKWSRSAQCHHLNKFGSTWVRDAVSRSSVSRFRRKRFLKVFTIIIWDWKPSWSFEQIFIPTSHGGSIWNLASTDLVLFEEKKF